MNKLHQKRIIYVVIFAIGLALSMALILYALKENINVFLTPTEVKANKLSTDYAIRLGGMVKKQSVKRDAATLAVEFIVTDFNKDIVVRYTGILPDLFREGKGVITEGRLNAEGVFVANTVLAKHDENYMPKGFMPKEVS